MQTRAERETLVAYYSTPKFRNLSLDHGRPRSAGVTATKLASGVTLIVGVLLSLGLWTAIWLAICSVTDTWFR